MRLEKGSRNRLRARIFNSLSDPARLEIIECLRGGEMCVCEIIPQLGLVQPLVSRHLRILKDCGVVRDRKDGNKRLYSVTDNGIFQVVDSISQGLIDALSREVVGQIS